LQHGVVYFSFIGRWSSVGYFSSKDGEKLVVCRTCVRFVLCIQETALRGSWRDEGRSRTRWNFFLSLAETWGWGKGCLRTLQGCCGAPWV